MLKVKSCCRENNSMAILWKRYVDEYVALFYDIKVAFNPWGNKLWYTWDFEKKLKGRVVNLLSEQNPHEYIVGLRWICRKSCSQKDKSVQIPLNKKKIQESSICGVSWNRYFISRIRDGSQGSERTKLYIDIYSKRISVPYCIKDKTDWDSDLISWFLENGLNRWHGPTERFIINLRKDLKKC